MKNRKGARLIINNNMKHMKKRCPLFQPYAKRRNIKVYGVYIKKKLYLLNYGLFSKDQIFKKNNKAAIQSNKKDNYSNNNVYFGEIGRKIV